MFYWSRKHSQFFLLFIGPFYVGAFYFNAMHAMLSQIKHIPQPWPKFQFHSHNSTHFMRLAFQSIPMQLKCLYLFMKSYTQHTCLSTKQHLFWFVLGIFIERNCNITQNRLAALILHILQFMCDKHHFRLSHVTRDAWFTSSAKLFHLLNCTRTHCIAKMQKDKKKTVCALSIKRIMSLN